MARRIQLIRYEAENVNFRYYSAYRLRIEARDAEGPDLDNYVFVYQRGPVDPYTGLTCDEFLAVAGPYELATLPIGEPDPLIHPTQFRLDFVEDDYPSTALALRTWKCIHGEVCILVEALTRLARLRRVESVWCPEPPLEEVSESVVDEGGGGTDAGGESTSS